MDRIVIYNAIKTPDGTVLISRHRHDYVTHVDSISKETYLTDGGTGGYVRRSVNVIPAEDLSVYADDDFELVRTVAVRGSRGVDGNEPLHWIKICDMTDDHLKAVLEYGGEQWHLDIIKKEIEWRKKSK